MTETRASGISIWKTGIVAFLLLLLVIFIIQNITAYRVSFLLFEFAIPGAVLVLVAFLLGVAVTLIMSARRARARR